VNIPALLYEIASAEMKENSGSKSYYYLGLDASLLAPRLRQLALQIKGPESLTNDEVLGTFLTGEAIEELVKLPNCYWFWAVLLKALISHATSLAGDEFVLIELATVQEAIAATRNSLNYDYGLDRHHETLNAAETAAWVAEGLLLVHINGERKIELVRNYIFQSASSHKVRLVAA
jgi:hypothetical protein